MNKLNIIATTVIVIMILLTAVACVSNVINNSAKLEGVTWLLESYGNPGNLTAAIADTEVTLTFDKDKKTISGTGGVNGYGGDYAVDGNKLTVSGVIHTLIASTNEALNIQESTFFKILDSADSYKIEGKQLTITGSEGVLVFLQK